jgi:type I restriction enzyme S subunit
MIADRLRAAILQAAISGQLTDQCPEDGTAAELLEKIAQVRAELIKAKELKKPKPLPAVEDDEKPFRLPENWKWVRLGEYARDRGQQKPQSRFSYIDISAIDNCKQALDIARLAVLEPAEAPSRARRIAQAGDVVYSTVRPYLHNACIVPTGLDPAPIVSTGLAVLTTESEISNELLLHIMVSPYFDAIANRTDNARGVAYPAINNAQLKLLPVPVPPLAEQERIVAKLDEILPLIDQLAALESEREHLDREFATAIERAILQAAISGKLTKQHPDDGTAAELLETIQAERQQLEKEGKIRKQKPLPLVDKADEPFDVPDGWTWSRLGGVFQMQAGKNVPVGDISETGEYPCYGGNGIRGYVSDYNREGTYPIIGRQGALCGNIKVASGRFFATEHAVVVETFCETSPIWAAQALEQLNLNQYATATAQPGLSVEKLKVVPIPIPPPTEQQRIASIVEASRALTGDIKALVE